MPELVEVEAARRLCDVLAGKTISRAWVKPDETKVVTFPCPELATDTSSMQDFLTGCKLKMAARKGKQLALKLEKDEHGCWLFVHLGMAGSIIVEGEKELAYKSFTIDSNEWPPRYAKIELEFEDGRRWAFCDMRRFGKAFLIDNDSPFDDLAPDAFLELPSQTEWAAALQKQRCCLKALLLDQKRLVSGVGNWIADEVLYQAKLHPDTPANSLSVEEACKLRDCLNYVLQEACRRNGETFPENWLFNYRWGKGKSGEQTDYNGNTIEHITSGGRTSAIVPAIQQNPSKGETIGKAALRTGRGVKTEEVKKPIDREPAGNAKAEKRRRPKIKDVTADGPGTPDSKLKKALKKKRTKVA